jgi:hypothetical protein
MAPVNLGTGRIVVIVALLVVGAAVLANGFADGSSGLQPGGGPSGSAVATETPTGTTTGTSSPTAAQTPAPQDPSEVLIQVFNGTTVTGLGGTAQMFLEGKGYTANGDAQDAPSKPVPKTIVYYRGGASAAQNESNATHMAKKYFKGAKVQELDPEFDTLVGKRTQVVVVVGDDYAATIAT